MRTATPISDFQTPGIEILAPIMRTLMFLMHSVKSSVIEYRRRALFRGPGEFRELREAHWKHFHLS